jgi:hypothetical protein
MASTSQLKIYGIRHHGPGSAKSLIKSLEAWQPDALLIEGPPDADNMIRHVGNEGMKPPVALLVYNPKDLQQASYFPFAEFSPEWQAIKWASKNGKQVSFMDLPMGLNFAFDNQDKSQQVIDFQDNIDENNADTEGPNIDTSEADTSDILEKTFKKVERDPLRYLAQMAGYTDSERWWEITFEQNENPTEVFDAILEMMTLLRAHLNRKETDETLLREAYMRQTMRKAIKQGYAKIAVICGAWHAPVLEKYQEFKEKNDTDILKSIKKVTTETTWVPWSYARLSLDSGYMAGITSPAWYELLFNKRSNATIRWMTKAARLLRKEDLSASSAHSIEAVRLAETLAILRGRTIAGMDELEEAALSIFCEGYDAPMKLIRENLVIGDTIGKVPPEIPQVPLQRDLEAQIKTARLSKEYGTSEAITKELDLRKETNLIASHLLHRLSLLNIPWGKPMKGSRFRLGSFKEIWKLTWKPDYAIRIIEAAQWGNTVLEAANNFVKKNADSAKNLPELTALTENALNADLKETIPILIKKLQDVSALTDDTLLLMDALPALVNIAQYGNVRGTDIEAVKQVIEHLIPRICIGLPTACVNTDDEATALIFNKLHSTHKAINLFQSPANTEGWHRALRQIATMQNVHGMLVGGSIRILFDKNVFNINQTATQMRYALSKGNESQKSAAWLEGFLHGSGLLLIHHESLWQVLDEWVADIDMDRLTELLPLLRRTFSNFSTSERQKILALVTRTTSILTPQYEDILEDFPSKVYDIERGNEVLKTLQLFL